MPASLTASTWIQPDFNNLWHTNIETKLWFCIFQKKNNVQWLNKCRRDSWRGPKSCGSHELQGRDHSQAFKVRRGLNVYGKLKDEKQFSHLKPLQILLLTVGLLQCWCQYRMCEKHIARPGHVTIVILNIENFTAGICPRLGSHTVLSTEHPHWA